MNGSHSEAVADLKDAASESGGRQRGAADQRFDIAVVTAALAIIAAAAVVGLLLIAHGWRMLLPAPPLVAHWHPHLGWGTPLTVLCVLLGLRLQVAATALPWRRLLLAGWVLNLAWMCSLTLVDGLRRGWVGVLQNPNEYLHDLPRITDPVRFVATFTRFIAFGPEVDGTHVWTTHVAGHPPLATLLFWAIDRIGLGGGFWAGALCILVGSTASVALPVTVRELGNEAAGRRSVAFAALFPGAVWMAISADGLFAGVATSGLALAVVGARRHRLAVALVGGLLLGVAVFLSYGLVLFGLVVLAAGAILVHERGGRRVLQAAVVTTGGALLVLVVHLLLGFNWLTGLMELRVRYHQGIASQRPYAYFVWANFAAWLVSCSPLLAVGVRRAVAEWPRGGAGGSSPPESTQPRERWSPNLTVALLGLSSVLAALTADLSGLSKAETERIWLAFGAVAWTTLSLVPVRGARWLLLGAAGWAIAVNHLLYTGW